MQLFLFILTEELYSKAQNALKFTLISLRIILNSLGKGCSIYNNLSFQK
jgi:hypothetical protein